MELKFTNPNGGIVLASELKDAIFFFKLQKLHLEINPTSYVFQEDALTAQKTRMPITFS